MAYFRFDFPGWDSLKQKSRDIIIARCAATPDPTAVGPDGVEINNQGLIKTDMEIISVLKGITNSGSVKVTSEYWPRQSEYYLIFAFYGYGSYQANESYRFIPLGTHFVTNAIVVKTVDKQIQTIFQYRLNDLKRQMHNEQEEKERLAEAFKK